MRLFDTANTSVANVFNESGIVPDAQHQLSIGERYPAQAEAPGF
jgi:hypothetical protein